MKAVLVAAGINAGVILLWILSFSDSIGTPHQFFYFWLPAAFLIVPLLIFVADRLSRGRSQNEEIWAPIGCSALILNFIVFVGYLMISGGGV